MSQATRVLVVEDDADIWRSLQILFQRAGHVVQWAPDGVAGLAQFEEFRPDLVVLDIGLPGLNGWTVLERIRHHSHTPVLLLTARGLEAEKVRGLVSGADDYMTKPFTVDELLARVAALLRRSRPSPVSAPMYEDARLLVHFREQTVEVEGHPVALTPSEFRLLAALVRHSGQVLTNSQLLEKAWHDPTGTGPARVKFTVLSLRRKLGWSELSSCPIETVRGFGYRYQPLRTASTGAAARRRPGA